MGVSPTAIDTLVDFWLSLIKLLSRPAVQLQLLAIFAALLLAWLLAHWFVGVLKRRQSAREQRLRARIIAEEQARYAARNPDEKEYPEDADASGTLLVDAQALDARVAQQAKTSARLTLLVTQLVFPLVAIACVYGAYVYFATQGWFYGLLTGTLGLLLIYLGYRLAIGLAYMFGSTVRVRYYHQRLFGPLFGVGVVLLIVNTIADIRMLADATLFEVTEAWVTLGALFIATFGFYFWIMGISLVKDLVVTFYGRRADVNAGSLDASLVLVQYGLIGLGLFGVLQILQFDTTTIAAITGGLFIGIGFALQDVLKNFLGGVIVLFEGSVRPGDIVQVSGAEGTVDKLSIRSTIVRTFDNVEYIVPNQDWLNSTVTTYTRNNRRVRARVPVGVSYDADPHFVQKLLVETARAHPDVMSDPGPAAPLVDFGASSVDFVVLVWVDDAKIRGRVAGELRMQIWDALKANHIEIPYPQQDIHIRSGLLPAAVEGETATAGKSGGAMA